MDASAWFRLLLGLVVLQGGYEWWQDRAVTVQGGVVAPAEPLQVPLEEAAAVPHERWQLTPRARYDITARVLGRERYHFDGLADLVPVDLALGWGPMSDSRTLAPLKIEQSSRFYTVHWPLPPPIPPDDIMRHSANTHVIPANGAIARVLTHLRVGQVVHLTGALVDGARDDGARIRSSLSRADTGDGACEVMLVEAAEVLGPQRP